MALPQPFKVPTHDPDDDNELKSSMAHPESFLVPTQDDVETHEKPDQWLTRWMRNRGMTDAALLKAIQELGYEGTRSGNIANWRKGDATIPPEVFPKLFLALGFSERQATVWTCEILKQAYPDIAPFIRNPDKELIMRLRLNLLRMGQRKK